MNLHASDTFWLLLRTIIMTLSTKPDCSNAPEKVPSDRWPRASPRTEQCVTIKVPNLFTQFQKWIISLRNNISDLVYYQERVQWCRANMSCSSSRLKATYIIIIIIIIMHALRQNWHKINYLHHSNPWICTNSLVLKIQQINTISKIWNYNKKDEFNVLKYCT